MEVVNGCIASVQANLEEAPPHGYLQGLWLGGWCLGEAIGPMECEDMVLRVPEGVQYGEGLLGHPSKCTTISSGEDMDVQRQGNHIVNDVLDRPGREEAHTVFWGSLVQMCLRGRVGGGGGAGRGTCYFLGPHLRNRRFPSFGPKTRRWA